MRSYLYLITLFFLSLISPKAIGQVEKNVFYKVAIEDFLYTPKQEENKVKNTLETVASVLLTGKTTTHQAEYADAVRASIVAGFGHVTRLNVVENAVEVQDQTFLVDGMISNISTISKIEPSSVKGKPNNQYYRSLISVNINLKNAVTGEIVDSQIFSITDSDGGWISSAEKAMAHSLERLSGKITTYYNRMFPLSASIIEAGEVKKDKQKTVYIDLGTACGAYEGLQFDIFSVKTIAGKEASIEIGRLKIDKVLGEEISLCKVTRGEKEVKAALDNKLTLRITSRK